MPLTAVVSSPLERCRETVAPLLGEPRPRGRRIDDRFGEVQYGDWTGVELKKLAKDPLWPVVQSHPSGMTFPGEGGESMAGMQHRAVERRTGLERQRSATDATYLVCSHGDVIKAIVADALGMHLDAFQRINVDPASLTVIRYGKIRPFVVEGQRQRRQPRRADPAEAEARRGGANRQRTTPSWAARPAAP